MRCLSFATGCALKVQSYGDQGRLELSGGPASYLRRTMVKNKYVCKYLGNSVDIEYCLVEHMTEDLAKNCDMRALGTPPQWETMEIYPGFYARLIVSKFEEQEESAS